MVLALALILAALGVYSDVQMHDIQEGPNQIQPRHPVTAAHDKGDR